MFFHIFGADTVFRTIEEPTVDNTNTSDAGRTYDFNTADKVNDLPIEALPACGRLDREESYDLDFDHELLETEKYDAKRTYKKFSGYSPGVAVIGNTIVGVWNRDGNANVRFHRQDRLSTYTRGLKGREYISDVRVWAEAPAQGKS